ncbi:MAG: hypothetical protein PF447_11605 [Spirochaetaceae bacterium]|nr:hypothetical protein [Spirochaetaceae bacterium]
MIPQPGTWKQIDSNNGTEYTLGINADGSRWGFGKSGTYGERFWPQIDEPYSIKGTPIDREQSWEEVHPGAFFAVGKKKDGTWWSWGSNNCG